MNFSKIVSIDAIPKKFTVVQNGGAKNVLVYTLSGVVHFKPPFNDTIFGRKFITGLMPLWTFYHFTLSKPAVDILPTRDAKFVEFNDTKNSEIPKFSFIAIKKMYAIDVSISSSKVLSELILGSTKGNFYDIQNIAILQP